ncbi:Asr1405/Asl0597 family protein [Leptolyngbya sp. AN02str]|uniref:Asr1405/Asl0597 family protein n=1 Tax=Leptolyngbya sp. AN02str TaxID=3423363 RepID=UPI003D31B62D
MNDFTPDSVKDAGFFSADQHVVSINRSDRWLVCYRLQDLGIACNCLPDGSFRAQIDSPVDAIQLWSVMQQLTGSRTAHLNWLARCWRSS